MFLPISALFAFVFGAIIGSFLNVVIYRVPAGISVVFPPSRCPSCHTRIAWYDNVPILSWLILGGECRSCSAKISPRYAGVEALMGVFSTLLWLKLVSAPLSNVSHWVMMEWQSLMVMFFLYFTFLALCVVIAFIDLDHFIIPHELAIPGIVIGLASPWVLDALMTSRELVQFWPPLTPSISLIGAIVGALSVIAIFLLYLMLRGIAGMGGGDVTLMAMMGAWLGWPALLFIFFAASIQGLIIAGVTTALGIDFVKDAREVLDEPAPEEDQDATLPLNARAEEELVQPGSSVAEDAERADASPEIEVVDAEGKPREDVPSAAQVEAEHAAARGEAEEEGGPMAIPFGPFIVLAGLEHFFLGPFLPESISMIYMYLY